jgi:hypothetical protein
MIYLTLVIKSLIHDGNLFDDRDLRLAYRVKPTSGYDSMYCHVPFFHSRTVVELQRILSDVGVNSLQQSNCNRDP